MTEQPEVKIRRLWRREITHLDARTDLRLVLVGLRSPVWALPVPGTARN